MYILKVWAEFVTALKKRVAKSNDEINKICG